MIHEIGVELQASIQARGCPLPVLDGPERGGRAISYLPERIVIQRTGQDRFVPVTSQRHNPKHAARVQVGCEILIYAREPSAGAAPLEHLRRVEQVRDLVVVGLRKITIARGNELVLESGEPGHLEDAERSDVHHGALYRLQFSIGRAIEDRTWAGAASSEATLIAGQVRNTTKVSLAGGPDNDGDPTTVPATAETACQD